MDICNLTDSVGFYPFIIRKTEMLHVNSKKTKQCQPHCQHCIKDEKDLCLI